jgi:quercetin dioxygenase-like cupin family protein
MDRLRTARRCGVACLFLLSAAGSASAQDPVTVNADKIRVRVDNERVRVFESVLEPGEREQPHSHPATILYVIQGGKIRIHAADGTSSEVEIAAGDTTYRGPVTHWAENIGTTTVKVLVVEIKDAIPPASP